MSVALNELILYWQGELSPDREAEVEEAIFADQATAARLDAIARLDAGVRTLVARGAVEAGLTVDALEALEAAGLSIRSYVVERGETVPCTIAAEDLVAIRLRGRFGTGRVDVVMDGTFEGMPPASERRDDVPIDRRAGEIVLVYPGDRVRALPRSRFRYTVYEDGHPVGAWSLDHTPAAS